MTGGFSPSAQFVYNSAMRYLIFSLFLFVFPLSTPYAAPGVTPETVMRAAQLGAPQFALSAAEDAQTASPDRAQWLAWEVTRWDLLYQLKRWPALLQLTQDPPTDMPEAMRHYASWRSAQAMAALHLDDKARELLGRLIWQGGLDAVQRREARRLVIETLFSQGRGDDAYLAVLRYRQDFHPLERSEIESFAQGLSVHGKAAEALAWLPQVGDPALALLLKLRGGVVQVQEAAELARSELKKSGRYGYWAVLGQAAILQQNHALHVEALENLLSLQNENMPAAPRLSAEDLWQGYNALALTLGNQHQLLLGDEGAWMTLAKAEQQDPRAARALFAHLVRHAKNQAIRGEAETHLFHHLVRGGLARTAFRLLADHSGMTLMLANDPAWLGNAAIRRSVLLELALHETRNEEHERAAEYLLQLLGAQP